MRHQLILAGLSILSLSACGSDSASTAAAGGVPSATAGAAGSATTSAGGSTSSSGGSSAGAPANTVAGAPASGGANNVGGASAKGGSGGGPAMGAAGGGSSSAGAGGAGTTAGCTREALQAVVDAYHAAQVAGDKSKMPLAASVTYTENFKTPTKGIWETPLNISYQHDLLDTEACQSFSEVYVTDSDVEYVLGIRLASVNGQITEIESIVTTGTVSGSAITSMDWNFDAKAYETCAKSEDWSVVPEASRSSRADLIAAGEAYFMVFSDKSTLVPWGMPCYRLEGGKGCTPAIDMASTTCNVGVPSGITFKSTHWVVDLDLNTAVGMTQFAGVDPDSHTFRLIDGKIRKVHTLTQGTGS